MSEETSPTPETPPPNDEAKTPPAASDAEAAPGTAAPLPRAKIKLPGAAPGETARPKLTIRKSTAAESGPAPSDPLFDAKKETVRIELPPRPGAEGTVKLPPQAGPVQADHDAAEVKSSTVKLTIPRGAPPRPPAVPATQQPKSETARISLPAQEQTPGVSSAALGGASGLRIRREEPPPPPPPEPPPPEPPPIEEPVETLPPVEEEPIPEPVAPRRRTTRPMRVHADDELDAVTAIGAILSMLAALGVAAFLFLEWQKFSGMLQ